LFFASVFFFFCDWFLLFPSFSRRHRAIIITRRRRCKKEGAEGMDVFFRREKEQKLKFANSSIFGHFFLDDARFIRPKSMNLQILIFTQQQTKKSLTD